MNRDNFPKGLYDFLIAILLGPGEKKLRTKRNCKKIIFPVLLEKEVIIDHHIKTYKLEQYFEFDQTKSTCTITLPLELNVIDQWYKGNRKVVREKDITLTSCVLYILLFGEKRLLHLEIPTTIDEKFIRTVAFNMQRHLRTYVEPTQYKFKIYDVRNMILKLFAELPLIESAFLMNYLNSKESFRMKDVIDIRGLVY